MLLATLPRCEECNCPAPDGYRNATSRDEEPILRCRICYERRVARVIREAILPVDYTIKRKLLAF